MLVMTISSNKHFVATCFLQKSIVLVYLKLLTCGTFSVSDAAYMFMVQL